MSKFFFILFTLLFFSIFSQGFIQLVQLLGKTEFRENALGFFIVLVLFVFTTCKKSALCLPKKIPLVPYIVLISVSFIFTLNRIFFSFELFSPILSIVALYAFWGFFVPEPQVWRRNAALFLLLVLCLPLLERVQKFGSFPLREFTATVVGFFLRLFGFGSISQSGIIVTENKVTSVDLPCSGITSLYTGTIVFTGILFLEKIKVSWKIVVLYFIFLGLLMFANVWRVFSLVVVSDIYNLPFLGESIHISLGIVGFVVSVIALLFFMKRFTWERAEVSQRPDQKKNSSGFSKIVTANLFRSPFRFCRSHLHSATVPISVACISLICFVPFQYVAPKEQTNTVQIFYDVAIPNANITELPLTKGEKLYFETNEVAFLKKYRGTWGLAEEFSLLFVGSTSARSHHDPETCLQAMGYRIVESNIIELSSIRMRKLTLNEGDTVYYWFIGKDKTVVDYSQRVFEQWKHRNAPWVLGMIGFPKNTTPNEQMLIALIDAVSANGKRVVDIMIHKSSS